MKFIKNRKGKGKDVAYITHPLAVGLILSLAGVDEDVVVAGILHDTIEDSTKEKKVTGEMLEERFGGKVSDLVLSVTEDDKSQSWEKRKRDAIGHIKNFSKDSLMLKSADIISNNSELIDEYMRFGKEVFERFNAPMEKVLAHYVEAIETILSCWEENPLKNDLRAIKKELQNIK